MDSRNWKAEYGDENKTTVIIRPDYDEEVTNFMESDKDYFNTQNTALKYGGLLHRVLENKATISFKEWSEIYDLYANQEQTNVLYDRPATLAVIGLSQMPANLSPIQQQWCIDTLIDIIIIILQDAFTQSYGMNFNYNSTEKKTALTSFHLIYDKLDENNRAELMATLICVLIAPFAEHEIRYLTEYCRDTFFEQVPGEAIRIWTALIKYAEFKKAMPHSHYHFSDEEKAEQNLKQTELIQKLSTTIEFNTDLSKIDFKSHEWYILVRALMITPIDSDQTIYFDFIKHLIPIIMFDIELELNYSYNKEKDERQVQPEQESDIRNYFVKFFLYGSSNKSEEALGLLLNATLNYGTDHSYYRRHDPYKFCSQIFESLIYELDSGTANSTDSVGNTSITNNFWNIWAYLFNWSITNGSKRFVKILLLDISWKTDSTHWKPLENKKEFYHSMVLAFGAANCKSIIKFFSTIGNTIFLPEGLSWIVKIIEDNPSNAIALINSYGEKMIKRLFLNSITSIKNDSQLIADFVFLLNRMVDLGSSQAYFYRENVITFKVDD